MPGFSSRGRAGGAGAGAGAAELPRVDFTAVELVIGASEARAAAKAANAKRAEAAAANAAWRRVSSDEGDID